MKERNFDRLIAYAQKKQIEVTDEKLQKLSLFYDMMIEKNKVMNLTAITEWNDVVLLHFIDSLSLAECFDLSTFSGRVLDLGTGSGFPGIPLKIFYPGIEMTLFDSLNKRISFLTEVISALELSGIRAVHGRAEEIGKKDDHRESYDLVVSRAVANIATLSEYALPLVKVGGDFISYKTDSIEEEILSSGNAIPILGGKIENISYFHLPDSDTKRSLLWIKKVSETPKKYPRKAGTPSKDPLHG